MGVSGSGKTYSSLLLAKGICGDWSKVALIDSENGRGELYSDLGDYSVVTLAPPFTPEKYIEAIDACEKAGMEVIIIDSTSHEWDGEGGCLELNEKLAGAKYKGNTWAAWNETTPRHRRFIDKIISSSAHIIATMRSKADTIQTEDKKIKKVGLKEIQREGFEYEMTLSFNIEREGNYAVAGKDNTHLFDSRDPFKITEADGTIIRDWNMQAPEPTPPPPPPPDYTKLRKDIAWEIKRVNNGDTGDGTAPWYQEQSKYLTGLELKEENFVKILAKLEKVPCKTDEGDNIDFDVLNEEIDKMMGKDCGQIEEGVDKKPKKPKNESK
jgi:hypothetical protein